MMMITLNDVHTAGNMYAAGALEKVLALNAWVWRDRELADRAAALLADITAGIAKHGVVRPNTGSERAPLVYAYEVDGMGGVLYDFDDPNVPSLLSIPLLGFKGYDHEVYRATRQRILSTRNSHYFSGAKFAGMGSPHTPHNYIWPLAHMVQALTTTDVDEQAKLLGDLLLQQCGNGLMHESVDVNRPEQCTRPLFQWANAMLVATVEQLLHVDCGRAADEQRLADLQKKNGRRETGLYFDVMEGDMIKF